MSKRNKIRQYVDRELSDARKMRSEKNHLKEFESLERAHILGQSSTFEHVRVHYHMLAWGVRNRNYFEILGQILRLIGAAVLTPLGLIPIGNTGGSNVSSFKSMPIPSDLETKLNSLTSSRD